MVIFEPIYRQCAVIFFGAVLMLTFTAARAVAADTASYATIAARYQEVYEGADGHRKTDRLHVARRARQVEFARAGYVELWERDDRGEITWQRIFHEHRKLIGYTPGELRTQSLTPSWNALNTLIDTNVLKNLKRTGQTRWQHRWATQYRGRLGEENVDVLWLEAERLPAEIVRRGKNGAYRLSLRELRATPASGWPQAELLRAADYEYIDAADLGDREYDPFVRRVLAMDAARGSGHAH